MASFTQTLTTNTSVLVAKVPRVNLGTNQLYSGTVYSQGTFGGGTISWQVSFDGGVTKMPLKNIAGATAITQTAAAADNFQLGVGTLASLTDAPWIYATLAGAAGATVVVGLLDVN